MKQLILVFALVFFTGCSGGPSQDWRRINVDGEIMTEVSIAMAEWNWAADIGFILTDDGWPLDVVDGVFYAADGSQQTGSLTYADDGTIVRLQISRIGLDEWLPALLLHQLCHVIKAQTAPQQIHPTDDLPTFKGVCGVNGGGEITPFDLKWVGAL